MRSMFFRQHSLHRANLIFLYMDGFVSKQPLGWVRFGSTFRVLLVLYWLTIKFCSGLVL